MPKTFQNARKSFYKINPIFHINQNPNDFLRNPTHIVAKQQNPFHTIKLKTYNKILNVPTC